MDIECYRNWFLLLLLDAKTGTVYRWERYNNIERGRPRDELLDMLKAHTLVTFNGEAYDWWLMSGYLAEYNNKQLKRLSDYMIKTQFAQWNVVDEFSLEKQPGNHVDLMPVAPLIASLKVYAGRLHAPKLQDLPVDPSAIITDELRHILIEYCRNDLYCTHYLYLKLQPQVRLRRDMSKRYRLNLVSKSDPQIAEAVIKNLLEKRGVKAVRPEHKLTSPTHTYDAPRCIRFTTDEMRDAFKRVQAAQFKTSVKGALLSPKELRATIKFNDRHYKMGIGGLHSQEKSQSICIGVEDKLTDLDVTSYYPSLILTNELYPEHLSKQFLTVYQGIVDARVKAKHEGDTVTADALKIVINSSFGKFGNKYSVLYDPKLLMQTTISGQLYLLMLIEQIELKTACKVVSANTDGITVHSPNELQYQRMLSVSRQWEKQTRMVLEAVEYEALYAVDISNYLAIKTDGGTKGKGLFASGSLSKNPSYPIIPHAVKVLLTDGVDVEQTINECKDIKAFSQLRKVTGGALYRDEPIGSTVRWYHSSKGSPILYLNNANRVAGADSATLINDLPEQLPDDVDYKFYIDKAKELLVSVGAQSY